MSDDPKPDTTDAGGGRDVGQGYPEEQPGDGGGGGQEKSGGGGEASDRAPGNDSSSEGGPEPATGNPGAAGGGAWGGGGGARGGRGYVRQPKLPVLRGGPSGHAGRRDRVRGARRHVARRLEGRAHAPLAQHGKGADRRHGRRGGHRRLEGPWLTRALRRPVGRPRAGPP